jgi:hypothetical protein
MVCVVVKVQKVQWQAHEAPQPPPAAGALAVVLSPEPGVAAGAAAVSVPPEGATEGAEVPPEPPLKSVAYQPDPLS